MNDQSKMNLKASKADVEAKNLKILKMPLENSLYHLNGSVYV